MTFEAKKIAIGSDHRARGIVDSLASHMEGSGWSVTKHYGGDADSVDYPVPAKEVTDANSIRRRKCSRRWIISSAFHQNVPGWKSVCTMLQIWV